MSKLYNLYKLTKKQNPDKLILIKSGAFYLFLDEDAIKINKLLNLKLTPLNENIKKCGFPILSLPKYERILANHSISYLITSLDAIEPLQNTIEKQIICKIKSLDINNTSPLEAINILVKFQKELHNSSQNN